MSETIGEMNLVSAVASLAAATSHEINNPLMVVIGRLQLLDRTQQLDASGRMHLEAALAAADEIKEKVHRLGWITRLELADGGLGLPPMLDLEKSSQRTSEMTQERLEALDGGALVGLLQQRLGRRAG